MLKLYRCVCCGAEWLKEESDTYPGTFRHICLKCVREGRGPQLMKEVI